MRLCLGTHKGLKNNRGCGAVVGLSRTVVLERHRGQVVG
jgi:hypothetical protein